MGMREPRQSFDQDASRAPRIRVAVLEVRPEPDFPEGLGNQMRALEVDLCLVQNLRMPDGEEWLSRLTTAARLGVIPGPDLMIGAAGVGMALLSRWPILRRGFVDLAIPPEAPCRLMDLDFDLGGSVLRVVAVHLSRERQQRFVQERRLRAVLRRREAALVLGRFSVLGLGPPRGPGRLTAHRALRALWPAPLAGWGPRQQVRMASFPAQSLDPVALAPHTPAMIVFEVTAPLRGQKPASGWASFESWAPSCSGTGDLTHVKQPHAPRTAAASRAG